MSRRGASVWVASLLIFLLLAGCGGSGGGSAAGPARSTAATSGSVQVTVTRQAATKSASVLPSTTTSVTVTVAGTDISQTVPFTSGDTVTVVLNGVPIGLQTIIVRAFSGPDLVAEGRITIDVTSDTVVNAPVTLTPVQPSGSPSPSVSPTPSPTTSPTPSPTPIDYIYLSVSSSSSTSLVRSLLSTSPPPPASTSYGHSVRRLCVVKGAAQKPYLWVVGDDVDATPQSGPTRLSVFDAVTLAPLGTYILDANVYSEVFMRNDPTNGRLYVTVSYGLNPSASTFYTWIVDVSQYDGSATFGLSAFQVTNVGSVNGTAIDPGQAFYQTVYNAVNYSNDLVSMPVVTSPPNVTPAPPGPNPLPTVALAPLWKTVLTGGNGNINPSCLDALAFPLSTTQTVPISAVAVQGGMGGTNNTITNGTVTTSATPVPSNPNLYPTDVAAFSDGAGNFLAAAIGSSYATGPPPPVNLDFYGLALRGSTMQPTVTWKKGTSFGSSSSSTSLATAVTSTGAPLVFVANGTTLYAVDPLLAAPTAQQVYAFPTGSTVEAMTIYQSSHPSTR